MRHTFHTYKITRQFEGVFGLINFHSGWPFDIPPLPNKQTNLLLFNHSSTNIRREKSKDDFSEALEPYSYSPRIAAGVAAKYGKESHGMGHLSTTINGVKGDDGVT